MADTYKRLGALAPANTTVAILYTVPAVTVTIDSSIHICNLTSGEVAVDVAIVNDSGAPATEDYILFNFPIPGRNAMKITAGHALPAAYTIQVKTYLADAIAFSASGVEKT